MNTFRTQIIGYIRVSTVDQKTERQLDNIPCDKIFTDHVSGKTMERPQLKLLLSYVREGDTVIVHSMDRLARNTEDLLHLVSYLKRNKVTIRFIKEGITFDSTDNPMGQLMLTIMGAVAQFELSLMQERQREGIVKAKLAGKYTGSHKKLKPEQIEIINERLKLGVSKANISRELNITRQTIYNYLKTQNKSDHIEDILDMV